MEHISQRPEMFLQSCLRDWLLTFNKFSGIDFEYLHSRYALLYFLFFFFTFLPFTLFSGSAPIGRPAIRSLVLHSTARLHFGPNVKRRLRGHTIYIYSVHFQICIYFLTFPWILIQFYFHWKKFYKLVGIFPVLGDIWLRFGICETMDLMRRK